MNLAVAQKYCEGMKKMNQLLYKQFLNSKQLNQPEEYKLARSKTKLNLKMYLLYNGSAS